MKHESGAVSGVMAATDTIGVPHSVLEDIYAMIIGMAFVVVGLVLLKAAGLVTGGVAGIALLASYIFPLPVGTIFTLVNIPFFLFAYFTMGPGFALKSTIASFGITFALAAMPQTLHVAFVNPLFAAFVGGTLCGMGILALARHGAGVGGTGIVTLWLQRRHLAGVHRCDHPAGIHRHDSARTRRLVGPVSRCHECHGRGVASPGPLYRTVSTRLGQQPLAEHRQWLTMCEFRRVDEVIGRFGHAFHLERNREVQRP